MGGNVVIRLGLNAAGYSAEMAKSQRSMKQFTDSMKDAGHASVSSMQAASASIRLIEGDMTRNVRAVEKFITTIPGVGNALRNMFPLVGGLAFAGMLYKIGQEAGAAVQRVQKLPTEIQNSFREMNTSAETSIDQLDLSTAKIREQIDLLSGKRPNTLAEDLENAKLAADKLATSLESDNQKIQQLLSQHSLSAVAGLFTGRSGTAEVSGSVNSFDQQIADMAAQYQHSVRTGGPNTASLLKDLNDKQNAALAYANQQISARSGPQPVGQPSQEDNLAILTGFRNTLINQQDMQRAETDNKQAASQEKQLEDAKKFAEEQKRIQLQLVEQWRKSLDEQKALYEMSAADEAEYWFGRANTAKKGSVSYAAAIDEANKDIARINADTMRQQKEGQKLSDRFDDTSANVGIDRFDLSRGDNADMKSSGQGAVEYLRNLNEGIALQRENANAIAEASIQMALMTGQMGRLDAAQAIAALHAQQYKEQVEAIYTALANAQSLPDGFEKQQRIAGLNNQLSQAGGARQIQILNDQQALSGNTIQGAVKESLSQMVQAFTDMANQLKDVIPRTMESLNDDIAKAATGHGSRQDFGRTLVGAGQGLVKTGLQAAEGAGLRLLTHGMLGGPKRDGSSAMAALWVEIANGNAAMAANVSTTAPTVSSAVGGLASLIPGGSFIQPFIKAAVGFLPHFATGGDFSGGPMLVGENGPEIISPRGAGTVTPNNAIGGGDNHYHFNIQGNSDPAAMEAMLQRAAPRIVAASLQAHHRQTMNRPHGR